MTDYTQSTFFGPKDALSSEDPLKVIRGVEFDQEFAAISSAIAGVRQLASNGGREIVFPVLSNNSYTIAASDMGNVLSVLGAGIGSPIIRIESGVGEEGDFFTVINSSSNSSIALEGNVRLNGYDMLQSPQPVFPFITARSGATFWFSSDGIWLADNVVFG